MARVDKLITGGVSTMCFTALASSVLATKKRRNSQGLNPSHRSECDVIINGNPRAIIVVEPDIFESPYLFAFLCEQIEDVAIVLHERHRGLSWRTVWNRVVDEHHCSTFFDMISLTDSRVPTGIPFVFLCHGLGAEFTLRLLAGSPDLCERTSSIVGVLGFDGRAISSHLDNPAVVQMLLNLDKSIFSALAGTSSIYSHSSPLSKAVARKVRQTRTDGVGAIWARREWNAAIRGPYPNIQVDRVDLLAPSQPEDEVSYLNSWGSTRIDTDSIRRHSVPVSDDIYPFGDIVFSSRLSAIVDEAVDRA